mmetsp:Transcript_5189/g.8711  ORF Transcript_5189/g.8711 Transcript_5189/m.8711 type:complete len:369 (+) Transcript_5189:333-1439(+)
MSIFDYSIAIGDSKMVEFFIEELGVKVHAREDYCPGFEFLCCSIQAWCGCINCRETPLNTLCCLFSWFLWPLYMCTMDLTFSLAGRCYCTLAHIDRCRRWNVGNFAARDRLELESCRDSQCPGCDWHFTDALQAANHDVSTPLRTAARFKNKTIALQLMQSEGAHVDYRRQELRASLEALELDEAVAWPVRCCWGMERAFHRLGCDSDQCGICICCCNCMTLGLGHHWPCACCACMTNVCVKCGERGIFPECCCYAESGGRKTTTAAMVRNRKQVAPFPLEQQQGFEEKEKKKIAQFPGEGQSKLGKGFIDKSSNDEGDVKLKDGGSIGAWMKEGLHSKNAEYAKGQKHSGIGATNNQAGPHQHHDMR